MKKTSLFITLTLLSANFSYSQTCFELIKDKKYLNQQTSVGQLENVVTYLGRLASRKLKVVNLITKSNLEFSATTRNDEDLAKQNRAASSMKALQQIRTAYLKQSDSKFHNVTERIIAEKIVELDRRLSATSTNNPFCSYENEKLKIKNFSAKKTAKQLKPILNDI